MSSEGKRNRHFRVATAALKRIKRELAEITLDPLTNFDAGPISDDDLLLWSGTIHGPKNSCYNGGTFFLDIRFPEEYPFKPPSIIFRTKIYHCNINSKGEICLDVLKDNWSPALTITKVLLSIFSLMSEANPHDPLVPEIAQIYLNDREKHDKRAMEWVDRYARDI